MAKFDLNKIEKQARIRLIAEFYDILSLLENREEIRFFMRDLLSPDEIAMLHRRIQVAILLKEKYTFDTIVEKLHVGKDKVTKVRQSLEKHGEGYEIAIERLIELQSKRREKEVEMHKKRTTILTSPRRFPGYMLIEGLIDDIKENKLNLRQGQSENK